jgi:hypothetical protein
MDSVCTRVRLRAGWLACVQACIRARRLADWQALRSGETPSASHTLPGKLTMKASVSEFSWSALSDSIDWIPTAYCVPYVLCMYSYCVGVKSG